MHELSLCRAIAGAAIEAAAGRPVRRIGLRVGAMRQVVPDTLVYCWRLFSECTALSGSELDVESVPARTACGACGQTATLASPVLCCPSCGSTDVTLVAGEEFLLTALDLSER